MHPTGHNPEYSWLHTVCGPAHFPWSWPWPDRNHLHCLLPLHKAGIFLWVHQKISASGSQNPPELLRICLNILHPASAAFLPYPYCHTDRYSRWKDDNISYEMPEILRSLTEESPPDRRRIPVHMHYPDTDSSEYGAPARFPAWKMRPSSRYIQHH